MKNSKVIKLDNPFPAIAIDDFMSPALLRAAANSFPEIGWAHWHTYDGNDNDNMALKVGTRDRLRITIEALTALDYIATHFSPAEYFEDFGVNVNVFPDFEYYAAGMHMLPENGFLGMHLDADVHGANKIWKREYSVVLCASEEYDSSFDLLLHNTKEYSRVPYKFNRLMAFKCSENSWHGVPNRITPGMIRKTLPVFFWSKIDENESVENRRTRSIFRNDLSFNKVGGI